MKKIWAISLLILVACVAQAQKNVSSLPAQTVATPATTQTGCTAACPTTGTYTFTTTLEDIFSQGVTWSVTGASCGSINSSTGVLTPSTGPTCTIIATSNRDSSKTGSVSVTMAAGGFTDPFNGTNGQYITAARTGNPGTWTLPPVCSALTWATVDGSNHVTGNSTGYYPCAYLAQSTSDTSICLYAANGTNYFGPLCSVRMNTTTVGYSFQMLHTTAPNWDYLFIYKGDVSTRIDGANLGISVPYGTTICLKATASGTGGGSSPVVLTAYTAPYTGGHCGTFAQIATMTDSASPTITAGHPGFGLWPYGMWMGQWGDYAW